MRMPPATSGSSAPPPTNTVARSLFRAAFGGYVVVAVLVTLVLIIVEYRDTRADLLRELVVYERSFGGPLGISLWNMDLEENASIIDGILGMPDVIGVQVHDHAGRYLMARGWVLDNAGEPVWVGDNDIAERRDTLPVADALLAHSFRALYAHAAGETVVGHVTLYASTRAVLWRISDRVALIVGGAIFKTVALWAIFLAVGRRVLAQPLARLRRRVESFDPAVPAPPPPALDRPAGQPRHELDALEDAFAAMADRLYRSTAELEALKQGLAETVEARTAALKEANRELERSNAELEQFAYVASHDLREPLRMVTSYLSLLRRRHDPALPPEAREFITYAYDGAARMDSLILDLLEYSRAGRPHAEPAPVDLAQALGTALHDLGPGLRDVGGVVEVVDPLPTVVAGERDMVRLFENLLGNALKYRHPERPPRITVACVGEGDRWHLTVTDNGIGMPPEMCERIFLIFQRLHRRGDYDGTGIGLAICRKVVDRAGGHIWAESVPGEGSVFHITLPPAPPTGVVPTPLAALDAGGPA